MMTERLHAIIHPAMCLLLRFVWRAAGATMTLSLDGSAKVIEDHDVCLSLECTRRKRRSVNQKKQQRASARERRRRQ